jgi:hypothetical protein
MLDKVEKKQYNEPAEVGVVGLEPILCLFEWVL